MATIDDVAATWTAVERALELLPPGHPEHDAVRRAADALEGAYRDLAMADQDDGLGWLTERTILRARTLLDRVGVIQVIDLAPEMVELVETLTAPTAMNRPSRG